MKRVLLLRHAKSSWDFPELSDHDRPLNDRGRNAASRMGRYLEEREIFPDLILSSPAVRARDTAERVMAALSQSPDFKTDARLYLRGVGGILEAIRNSEARYGEILIVGHNPAMQEFAIGLDGGQNSSEMASLRVKYPTCALAEFEASVNHWPDLEMGGARLVAFTPVKALD